MIELVLSIVTLIIAVALIISVFNIAANTKRSAELLQEMYALQLMRDDATENQINGAATAKLITDAQRKYLLQRRRERHDA